MMKYTRSISASCLLLFDSDQVSKIERMEGLKLSTGLVLHQLHAYSSKQTQFPCSSLDWSIMGFSQLFSILCREKKEANCHVSILVSNFISLEQTLLIINGYPPIHTKTNRKQQERTPQMKKYQTSRANRYQQKKKNKQGPILPKLLYPIILLSTRDHIAYNSVDHFWVQGMCVTVKFQFRIPKVQISFQFLQQRMKKRNPWSAKAKLD